MEIKLCCDHCMREKKRKKSINKWEEPVAQKSVFPYGKGQG